MDADFASNPEFRVAVDVGTSNIAVAVYKDGMSTEVIHTIDSPDNSQPSRTNREVPTLITYPKNDAQVTSSTKAKEIRTLTVMKSLRC